MPSADKQQTIIDPKRLDQIAVLSGRIRTWAAQLSLLEVPKECRADIEAAATELLVLRSVLLTLAADHGSNGENIGVTLAPEVQC